MKEATTEEKVKAAARRVFIQKGMAGARMQEIADDAGINKALLHYYYRNKEQLFNAVFEDILKEFIPRLFGVLNSDLPLEVKVYTVAEKYIDFLTVHREIPMFLLTELHRHPQRLVERMHMKQLKFSNLETQLSEEIIKGNIRPISLEMFLMNMLSMLVFPFISRPLFQGVMDMDNASFEAFIEERKLEVPRYIMNALKP